MNYQRIYNELIEKAKLANRVKLKREDPLYIYYEKHHIIPKCIGGIDNKSNIVLLTAAEHFVAHQLLAKIHKGNNSLWYALYSMLRCNDRQIRNNKEFEWIKKSRKNITLSDERKKHLATINTGKVLTVEHRSNISKGLKGRIISAETRKKIGLKNSQIINQKIAANEYTSWNKGIPMTDSAKEKLSISMKDAFANGRKRSSTCFQKGIVPHNAINKIYFFCSPDKVIYKTDNITRFSKYMNLCVGAMACLNKGTYSSQSYKGWTIQKPGINDSVVEIYFNDRSG